MELIAYPKIKRLPLFPVPYRKEAMSSEEIASLFDGTVVIEEKIDGKHYWRDHGDVVVFYEYMRDVHTVFYRRLPSYEIAFDVYDKRTKRFLGIPEKQEVLKSLNYCYVPLIYIGEIDSNEWRSLVERLLSRPSYYGSETWVSKDDKETLTNLPEGVVIKNYGKQLFGKAINRWFDEAIWDKEHYTREKNREKRPKVNILYHGGKWLKLCQPNIPVKTGSHTLSF